MAEWGSKVAERGKEQVNIDTYDAPEGTVVEVHQTYYLNYLADDNDALNRVRNGLISKGQQPIWINVWKSIDGQHVDFQYRSSGELVTLILIVIIAALAVLGIYLLTQLAYSVIELIPPEMFPWILGLGLVTLAIVGLAIWKPFRHKT